MCVPNMLYNQWTDELRRCLVGNAWNILQYPTATKQAPSFWEAYEKRIKELNRLNKPASMSTVVVAAYSVSHLI